LGFKQTWAFVIGKFLTDPIWWFYLFWLPDFMESEYGLKGTQMAIPVAVVYTIATAGSIWGGWLPLRLSQRMEIFKARKTSMLIYAFLVLPIVFAQLAGAINMWLVVLVIGIAASAHQAWSANIFTTVSDMFPKRAVASVTGIGGMFGGLGGIALSLLVQKKYVRVLQKHRRHRNGLLYHVFHLWCCVPDGMAYHAFFGTEDGEDQALRRCRL